METLIEVPTKSYFVEWQGHIDKVVSKDTCPKCGSKTICIYADCGCADFDDVYEHVCSNPNCDFRLEKEFFSLGMTSRDMSGPPNCPFCGREV